MQRHLRGLRERADEQQEQAADEIAVVVAEDVGRLGEDVEEVERPRAAEDEERAEHEADVADHVDDERLDAGRVAVSRRNQNEMSR